MFWKYLLYHAALWMFPPGGIVEYPPSATASAPTRCLTAPGSLSGKATCPGVCLGTVRSAPSCPGLPPLTASAPMGLPCGDVLCHPPMPVFAVPPGHGPGLYQVDVRFTDGPREHLPGAVASLVVPEYAPESVTALSWYREGELQSTILQASIRPVCDSQVLLSLRVIPCGSTPGKMTDEQRSFHTCQSVDLDTVTGVVLRGPGKESYTASVTIHRLPPTPPITLACPVCPGCPASGSCAVPQMALHLPPPTCCPGTGMPCYHAPASCALPEPIPVPGVVMPVSARERALTPTLPRGKPIQHVRLIREDGKSRLRMFAADACTVCVRMTREAAPTGRITLAAGKKSIHVTGANWKALADEVDLEPDGRILLRGHVKLTCERLGASASVKAEELCVQVRQGKFERILPR